ncbi:MAG: zinc-ribbon domain-containing protein [Methanobacteriota archaeon]|nr:MAG: zinc-ribbon domain-containing protein [Euryarchaeota archaeon]
MNLLEAILAFRKSVFFRIFYLAILGLMVAALLSYIYLGCLTIFLIPLAMFAIPFWLKERRTKHLVLNGAIVFLIAALVFSGLLAQSLWSGDPVQVTGCDPQPPCPTTVTRITNVTVTPGRGAAGATYNFTANLTVPGGGNPANYELWANLTLVDGLTFTDRGAAMSPVDNSDMNLADGKQYYALLPVDDHMYIFWASVAESNGTSTRWFASSWQVGPITTGVGPFFGFAIYYGVFSLILPISFYFLLVMLFWWTQRARVERARLGMAAPTESSDTGFMCTNCGADVPAEAKACPKCGATFEEPAPATGEGKAEGETEPAKEEGVEPAAPPEREAEERDLGEDPDAKP